MERRLARGAWCKVPSSTRISSARTEAFSIRSSRAWHADVVDRLPLGAALISVTDRVIEFNRRARELLAQADGLMWERGYLAAQLPGESRALHALIRSAAQTDARRALFSWIEGWYNPHRRHSALGYLFVDHNHEQASPAPAEMVEPLDRFPQNRMVKALRIVWTWPVSVDRIVITSGPVMLFLLCLLELPSTNAAQSDRGSGQKRCVFARRPQATGGAGLSRGDRRGGFARDVRQRSPGSNDRAADPGPEPPVADSAVRRVGLCAGGSCRCPSRRARRI
jgi:hypothetical protein